MARMLCVVMTATKADRPVFTRQVIGMISLSALELWRLCDNGYVNSR